MARHSTGVRGRRWRIVFAKVPYNDTDGGEDTKVEQAHGSGGLTYQWQGRPPKV